jgi:hypothetical protein
MEEHDRARAALADLRHSLRKLEVDGDGPDGSLAEDVCGTALNALSHFIRWHESIREVGGMPGTNVIPLRR